VFHRPLASPASLPVFQMHLRGFRNFPSHQTTCRLGTVSVAGNDSGPDLNLLSGTVSIHASTVPENVEAWREEAGRLGAHSPRHVDRGCFAPASADRRVLRGHRG
jgi:hypothetical protein